MSSRGDSGEQSLLDDVAFREKLLGLLHTETDRVDSVHDLESFTLDDLVNHQNVSVSNLWLDVVDFTLDKRPHAGTEADPSRLYDIVARARQRCLVVVKEVLVDGIAEFSG
jgi:hypothetical protein